MFFSRISSRIFVIYIFFNVLTVAAVLESRVLLFTLISSSEPISMALSVCSSSDSGSAAYLRAYVLSIFLVSLAFSCCIMY